MDENNPYLQKVKQKASALNKAFEARDRAIVEARDAGLSLGQIAKASGLTRSGVQGVLARHEELS